MRTYLSLGILIALAPVACGPAPTPETPTNPATPGPAKGPAPVATGPALDLSPVPEPADVVGLVRWTSPASTLANLSGCAGLPAQLAEGNTRFVVERILDEMLPESVDEKQLSPVVALDAPVHAVVALDSASKRGKPIAAVSFGLTSLERARAAVEGGGAPTELSPGLWRIGGKERVGTACAIAASAGSTPARLICGDRDRDLTALAPYLARTLPMAPAAEGARDMHGEVRFVPITDKFGNMANQQLRGLPILAQSQLSIGDPKFDRTIVDAATALQGELSALLKDADKLTFDIGVDPKACLTLNGALDLRGGTSWVGGSINDQARRQATAPALFWRVPRDSETAFFSQGGDPSRFKPIFDTLATLLEGYLTKENVAKPADRKALSDLLRNLPMSKDAPSVSASGPGPEPAAGKDKDSPQALLNRALGGWMGWNIVGVADKPDATIKWFKDVVAAYNRPGLLNTLKKELGDDAKVLPTVKTGAAPQELGKNALAVEITFKDIPAPGADAGLGAPARPGAGAKAKPKTLTFTMHMLVTGDDTTTWIAFGPDRAELLRRLNSVKASAPDAESLRVRPGLEPLHGARVTSGGFLTIAPMTRSVGSTLGMVLGMAPGGPPEAQQALNLINNLPHKGQGPIFFTTIARGGAAPRGQFTVNLTKPALEDIGALVMGGLKLAGALNP